MYPSVFCPASRKLAAKITIVLISEEKRKKKRKKSVFVACLLSACESTLQAGRVLLSKTESNKAYRELVLHIKQVSSDFWSCSFLLVFCVHQLVAVGHQPVTSLRLYGNAGAAWCRRCLRRGIPVRFGCCRGPMLAASETEFLNGWLKANLLGSFTVLQRN